MAPPYEPLKIYRVTNRHLPVKAYDSNGQNLLDLVSEKDNRYVSDFVPAKFQGTTSMHDLILDPGREDTGDSLFLFLNGWIFPTDASINYAISQSGDFKVMPPCLQVKDRRGNWKTVIENIGFPMGKNKTVIVDLTGKFLSADHEVRIRTNMEIYWDYIYFSSDAGKVPVRSFTLYPASGDLHYRGFSAEFRKGGQYGPHWFDYSRVSNDPIWRDLTGNYTRFGDITGLLQDPDNAGDEMTVKFKSTGLPDLPTGWTRDFLIHSNGWVKDGDLNTATGNKVGPLPFHGMKAYPYSDVNLYPSDKRLRDYNKQYNTRVITDDAFRNALRKPSNN